MLIENNLLDKGEAQSDYVSLKKTQNAFQKRRVCVYNKIAEFPLFSSLKGCVKRCVIILRIHTFFHRSLNEKMDQRGFDDIDQMNEYMIDQWNSKVRQK